MSEKCSLINTNNNKNDDADEKNNEHINYNTVNTFPKTISTIPTAPPSSAADANKKIDTFFDDVGYCKYQYFLLFVFILVFFADGTEVLVITLILKSLENEWNITPLEKSLLASSAFIGLLIGSLITAKFIDLYGRKIFLQIGGITVIIFGYLCSLSQNVSQLFVLRVLCGIGIGAQIPAATNLAAESNL